MLRFGFKDDKLVSVTDDEKVPGLDYKNRNDLKDFQDAKELAQEATELTGDLHVACDLGDLVRPRYDVIRAPKVGDKVSYAFNGDCYPDGTIVKITKSGIVKTERNSYRRRKLSASWKQPGGTWSLVRGHINERNPEF